MKSLNTYIVFDGDCRDAMQFYSRCLDADLTLQTFAEAKVGAAPGAENRILHARLTKDAVVLMASDTQPGMPFTRGNNFSLAIECTDSDDQDRLFSALSVGGNVTMPLQDTFWGARFGMLTDRFGIGWMFNCEKEKR